ncbi:UNKNOWN [Stylonychia lemnae]|uniref:Uncharacterized protein n=1 Tax=Stylonychia lemnae TaxID=5949 RepID=A0A078AP33_STYLE|nr:UNKNOWN [Stylonychia lemnae]|eukprot:CDW83879.1 UNKNOWN [Stylonychia lemnae]
MSQETSLGHQQHAPLQIENRIRIYVNIEFKESNVKKHIAVSEKPTKNIKILDLYQNDRFQFTKDYQQQLQIQQALTYKQLAQYFPIPVLSQDNSQQNQSTNNSNNGILIDQAILQQLPINQDHVRASQIIPSCITQTFSVSHNSRNVSGSRDESQSSLTMMGVNEIPSSSQICNANNEKCLIQIPMPLVKKNKKKSIQIIPSNIKRPNNSRARHKGKEEDKKNQRQTRSAKQEADLTPSAKDKKQQPAEKPKESERPNVQKRQSSRLKDDKSDLQEKSRDKLKDKASVEDQKDHSQVINSITSSMRERLEQIKNAKKNTNEVKEKPEQEQGQSQNTKQKQDKAKEQPKVIKSTISLEGSQVTSNLALKLKRPGTKLLSSINSSRNVIKKKDTAISEEKVGANDMDESSYAAMNEFDSPDKTNSKLDTFMKTNNQTPQAMSSLSKSIRNSLKPMLKKPATILKSGRDTQTPIMEHSDQISSDNLNEAELNQLMFEEDSSSDNKVNNINQKDDGACGENSKILKTGGMDAFISQSYNVESDINPPNIIMNESD